jgi:hypothetical protein
MLVVRVFPPQEQVLVLPTQRRRCMRRGVWHGACVVHAAPAREGQRRKAALNAHHVVCIAQQMGKRGACLRDVELGGVRADSDGWDDTRRMSSRTQLPHQCTRHGRIDSGRAEKFGFTCSDTPGVKQLVHD